LEDIRNDFPYKDIINLERPFSVKHPRSNREARAAQFAPFAALNGFEDEIIEVQRLTSKELYLDDEEIAKINNQLNIILESNKNLYINIVYFLKDKRKTGGKYINKSGYVRRIDSYNNVIIFNDKEKIKINDIVKIEIIDLSNDNNLI
jgi:hypothetical protein